EARFAGRYDLARDDVGVDERRAELDEFFCDYRFAARDSACQADGQHAATPEWARWFETSTLEQKVLIQLDQGLAPKQRDPAGAGEIGAERDGRVPRAAAERDHRH